MTSAEYKIAYANQVSAEWYC